MLAPVGDELFDWQPSEDEWSIRRTVLHLYDIDNPAFAGRIKNIVAKAATLSLSSPSRHEKRPTRQKVQTNESTCYHTEQSFANSLLPPSLVGSSMLSRHTVHGKQNTRFKRVKDEKPSSNQDD